MQKKVLELLSGRQGHFLLESGHHGDLWFDLETLCLQPRRAQAVAVELTAPLSDLQLQRFHFWCLQSDRTQRGFSSRKAALRCPVLFRVEVKML